MDNEKLDVRELYLCKFETTETDKIKYSLAKQYHDETEAYDRLVCTGPARDGCAMPATGAQFQLINTHARQVRDRVMVEAELNGISRADMQRAISRFHSL